MHSRTHAHQIRGMCVLLTLGWLFYMQLCKLRAPVVGTGWQEVSTALHAPLCSPSNLYGIAKTKWEHFARVLTLVLFDLACMMQHAWFRSPQLQLPWQNPIRNWSAQWWRRCWQEAALHFGSSRQNLSLPEACSVFTTDSLVLFVIPFWNFQSCIRSKLNIYIGTTYHVQRVRSLFHLLGSVYFLQNSKNFTRFPVTSNLWTYAWSIKCR
jgi:hypothetical protein